MSFSCSVPVLHLQNWCMKMLEQANHDYHCPSSLNQRISGGFFWTLTLSTLPCLCTLSQSLCLSEQLLLWSFACTSQRTQDILQHEKVHSPKGCLMHRVLHPLLNHCWWSDDLKRSCHSCKACARAFSVLHSTRGFGVLLSSIISTCFFGVQRIQSSKQLLGWVEEISLCADMAGTKSPGPDLEKDALLRIQELSTCDISSLPPCGLNSSSKDLPQGRSLFTL